VQLSDASASPLFLQPLQRVLADRLQHCKARLAVVALDWRSRLWSIREASPSEGEVAGGGRR